MTREARRWLIAGGVALLVAALFGVRWAAIETAEHAWAATIPGGAVYAAARDLARLVRGVILLAAGTWGVLQVYLVYRAIGSVQVPRRVGNIEIVEAIPQRVLLGVTLALGLAYGALLTLGTGDWWLAASLAASPPRFDLVDPVLERDLGYYLSALPWWSRLQDRAFLVALSGLLLAGLLYFAIGSLRFQGFRPVASAHARSHLGALLTTLALTVAWGAMLDPAEVVAGAHGPLDHAALTARLPGAAPLVLVALIVAALSLTWAWRGRPAFIGAAWGLLLVTQLTVDLLAPALVRAARGRTAGPADPALAGERVRLERLAFGLEHLRDAPLPEFARPRDAIAAWPLWDARRVMTVARDRGGLGRSAPSAAAPYLPPNTIRPEHPRWLVTAAPDEQAWQAASPPPSWDEIHRGPAARAAAPALSIETDTALAFERAPARDSVTWFGTGFRQFAVVSRDQWPAVAPAGIPLDTWWRRAAFALALQSPELLDSDPGAVLLWRREAHGRLARLLPPATFDDPAPLVHDGALWWVAYGYVRSDLFPLAGRYFRTGFVGTVQATSGETRIYLIPGHDPLSAAWARVFEPLVRPAAELPAALVAALPFPVRAFDAAAAHLARTGSDSGAWERRPPQPVVVPAPTEDGRLALWTAQAFETARPAALVAFLGGRMTPLGPVLRWWRPDAPAPRPTPLVGSVDTKPGVLRFWPTAGVLLSVQAQFAEPAGGAAPVAATVTRVYLSWGTRRGEGALAAPALADLEAGGSRRAPADTTVAARWREAQRIAAQADSALARGDLEAFARLYQRLRAVLAPPRAPR